MFTKEDFVIGAAGLNSEWFRGLKQKTIENARIAMRDCVDLVEIEAGFPAWFGTIIGGCYYDDGFDDYMVFPGLDEEEAKKEVLRHGPREPERGIPIELALKYVNEAVCAYVETHGEMPPPNVLSSWAQYMGLKYMYRED